jgi:hypothetical protein
MDIISAYREVGSYRGAAVVCGTTAKTVKRVIARHEAGGAVPARRARGRNYDQVSELVAGRIEKTKGRISAKRLFLVRPENSGHLLWVFATPRTARSGTRCGPL